MVGVRVRVLGSGSQQCGKQPSESLLQGSGTNDPNPNSNHSECLLRRDRTNDEAPSGEHQMHRAAAADGLPPDPALREAHPVVALLVRVRVRVRDRVGVGVRVRVRPRSCAPCGLGHGPIAQAPHRSPPPCRRRRRRRRRAPPFARVAGRAAPGDRWRVSQTSARSSGKAAGVCARATPPARGNRAA